MKRTVDQVVIAIIYLISINIYYVLWYLGSEGAALDWGRPGLTFWNHWLTANITSVLNAVLIIRLLNRLDAKEERLEMPRTAPAILIVSLVSFGIIFSLIFTLQAIYAEATSVFQFLMSKAFISISLYHLVVAGLMMLLHLAALKSGGIGQFFKQLFKGSRAPRPVVRGFAFIDLNSSTVIAEKLGHATYSELLRKCFDQLEEVLNAFPQFEVYQYVGDEAVITWKPDKGVSEDALTIYHMFAKSLEANKAEFVSRFELSPTFKCAIHSGEVMESEMGNNKPQTAYHGDVLNMCSRILSLCHQYQTPVLISDDYRALITSKSTPEMISVQHEFINGRTRKMKLYIPIRNRLTT